MYKYRINKKLSCTLNKLTFQQSHLIEAMKYSIFSGGKRLRSCLIYATGEALKVNIITLDVISAAVECIHAYSLIHDDLPCMDNDDMRRGKPSCHIKYNENISLLAGDALQSLSFHILSNDFMPNVSYYKRINMICELSNAIGASGMCMGQMLDLESKNETISYNQSENINFYKTAFLIRSSIRLVYLSSNNVSKDILRLLDRFSRMFGLAFQIQDDILDYQDDTVKITNYEKIKHNADSSVVRLNALKKKREELYEQVFFILKILKKKIDINTLEQLIRFMIKRVK